MPLPSEGDTMSFIYYKSDSFVVTADDHSGVDVTHPASGESVYFQPDEANQLCDELTALEDKWADDDVKRVDFSDYLLSQYFGND